MGSTRVVASLPRKRRLICSNTHKLISACRGQSSLQMFCVCSSFLRQTRRRSRHSNHVTFKTIISITFEFRPLPKKETSHCSVCSRKPLPRDRDIRRVSHTRDLISHCGTTLSGLINPHVVLRMPADSEFTFSFLGTKGTANQSRTRTLASQQHE